MSLVVTSGTFFGTAFFFPSVVNSSIPASPSAMAIAGIEGQWASAREAREKIKCAEMQA